MKNHKTKKAGVCEGCGRVRKLTEHHVYGKKQNVVQGICEECHILHNKDSGTRKAWGRVKGYVERSLENSG